MTVIGWMLSRMILIRFVTIILGITIFVVGLNVVTYSDEILRRGGGTLASLAEYGLLLMPVTAATFMQISVLLAILLALVELSYRGEITAIWATGVSPFRVAVMLLPLGLVLGGLTFLISDQAVPKATPKLRDWAIGEYGRKAAAVGEKDPIWMRAGGDILRAGHSNPEATRLEDVIIFRRDAGGLLAEQIMAREAVLAGDRWELADVVVYYRENVPPNRLARLVYSGAMRPAQAGSRSGDPEEMSTGDLGYFIENAGFGIRPAHVYTTWWHRRISLLVSSWLMVLLCLPLAVRFRRGGIAGPLFLTGMAIGFSFSIFEGIALTMGEVGFVPAWFAAWAPVLVFGALAAALAFRAETVS